MDKKLEYIISYTKKALDKDESPDQIVDALKKKGYTLAKIEQGFVEMIEREKKEEAAAAPKELEPVPADEPAESPKEEVPEEVDIPAEPVFREQIATKQEEPDPGFSVFSRSQADNFEKLSSLAALAFSLRRLPLYLFIIGPVIFISIISGGLLWIAGILGSAALLALDLVYSWLYISRFIFTLEGKNLLVRKGVIMHSYTVIPYENIQDVHVVQSLTDRLFGLWSVIIFTATASSAGSEQVIGLPRTSAEGLKDTIFLKIKEARHVTD